MKTALLLLRTPLQAWIAQQVLALEKVAFYDVLYFTHNDSPEDRYYFKKLSAGADRFEYLYAPIRRFDILGHLDLRWQARKWYRDSQRDFVMLASVDAYVINAIANRQSGKFLTLDDGSGNFVKTDRYHIDSPTQRERLYRKLLGAANLAETKERIARHYTLYPNLPNIVEPGRLHLVSGWGVGMLHDQSASKRTYFIGQPFSEALTEKQISLLTTYLLGQHFDKYVRHPRERKPLALGAPMLDKKGRIAEDAILTDAHGQAIHLVGWFSTVMFNLANVANQRTMLLFKDDPNTTAYSDLARQSGCEIVIL